MDSEASKTSNIVPLSVSVLDRYDGDSDQFEMTVDRLERYFLEYEDNVKDGEVLVPSYLNTPLSASQQKKQTPQTKQKKWTQPKKSECHFDSIKFDELCMPTASDFCELAPTILSKDPNKEEMSKTKFSDRKRKEFDSAGKRLSKEMKETSESTTGTSDNNKKQITDRKLRPEKQKKGKSLQDYTQMSFTLPPETPFRESLARTSVETWAKPYAPSVLNAIGILSQPTVFKTVRATLEDMLPEDTDPDKLIPKSVIQTILADYSNKTRKLLQKTSLEKNLRYFMHQNSQDYPTTSKEYWLESQRNLNFSPPAEIPADFHATTSQRNEYQRLLSSIQHNREVLSEAENKQIENYKCKKKTIR